MVDFFDKCAESFSYSIADSYFSKQIKAQRVERFLPGDQISYYVTGNNHKVRIFDNCKLASEWNPKKPDENVEHYKKKLLKLYEKFKPFLNDE